MGDGMGDGIVVADFTMRGPGPFASAVLAGQGARVIKIEPPSGDPARAMPAFFDSLNAGKESVVCDLRTGQGRALALRIASRADVLLNAWRPGDAERFGLGVLQLREAQPRLVHCSITGFGSSGPLRDRPGQDLSYLAASGALAALGPDAAATSGLPIGDSLAGVSAAGQITAALLRAARTGVGAQIEVSVAGVLADVARLSASAHGTALDPRRPTAGRGAFACRDGKRLVLALVAEDGAWARLCAALGLDAFAGLPAEGRAERVEELQNSIVAALAEMPSDQAESRLDDAGVPWSWIAGPGEAEFPGGIGLPAGRGPQLDAAGPAVSAEFSAEGGQA